MTIAKQDGIVMMRGDMTGKELLDYMSVRQAASNLGITRQGVDWLIKNGKIDASYVDTFYLIPKSEVDRIIKSQRPTRK